MGSSATLARSVSLRFPSGLPTPVASEVDGVGSSETVAGSPSAYPRPFASRALGVGKAGEEEQPLALVGTSDLVRTKSAPLRIEPEGGKVSKHGVEAE
ncbi:hypothetical protein [Streptomyces vastus]|uniref:hypothetical protein n=1 Tax=Streptomyces vastus TaxID=285451 RepID=UPI0031CDDA67